MILQNKRLLAALVFAAAGQVSGIASAQAQVAGEQPVQEDPTAASQASTEEARQVATEVASETAARVAAETAAKVAAETAAAQVAAAEEARAKAAAEEPKPEPLAGYEKSFFLRSPEKDFTLAIQGRVQGRYTFLSSDGDDGRTEASNFTVQRARITFGGDAFKKIEYKFQADFGRGTATLKDYYFDYKFGETMLRAGQFKRPFSRQQITSSGSQEFVDRSITDRAFQGNRDVGLMVHNNYEKSPEIEWAVGLFNANGENQVPTLFGPALVARVGYNGNGIKGYSEVDLEGGPLRFGIAASVLTELDINDEQTPDDPEDPSDRSSAIRAELDYIVKSEGFSSTGGVYFATTRDPEENPDTTNFGEQTPDLLGFHLQAGYLVNNMHQVAGRFAMIVDQKDGSESGDQMEVTAVYSLYLGKHGLKWQTDVSLLASGADSSLGDRVQARSQLQLSF